MKWGTILHNSQATKYSSELVISQTLEIAEASEKMGIESLWLAERHFSPFGVVGSPLTAASFLLGKTSKLKVGSLNHVITTHHPVRVAEEACLIDQISDGRLLLGLSQGDLLKDFVVFKRDIHERKAVFGTWYDIINQSFTQGRAWADNEFINFPEISINPHPYSENGPKHYIYANDLSIIKWAAERGLPLILRWSDSDEDKATYMKEYNTIAQERGYNIHDIEHCLSFIAHIAEDADTARQEVKRRLFGFFKEYFVSQQELELALDKNEDENQQKPTQRAVMNSPTIDEEIELRLQNNPLGSVSHCIDIVQRGIDMTGAKHVICSFESLDSTDKIIKTMELFHSKIAPRVNVPQFA